MQVSGVNNTNFRGLTPEALEARAMALEEADFDALPSKAGYMAADMLDGRLKKSEKGRNLINALASGATFAAAVVSFKKFAPKLRGAIGHATTKIAHKLGSKAKGTKVLAELADEVAQNGEKIASNGTGEVFTKFIKKITGKHADGALKNLKKIGIETGGDVADLAIAGGAAILAGHEAGDIVDGKQKEATIGGVVKDFAKAASALSGMSIE